MTKNQAGSPSKKVIDENLKKVFQTLAEDEIPDRFKDLLRQLKEQDGQNGS